MTPQFCQKKKLRFDPTWGSYNSGLKNYRITNNHIFGIARTSAFIWHPRIPLKNFCKRTRRVCVCIVLVHFGRYSQEVNEKSVKLAVWAVSLNFLHDFTLFVVDIHQIRLISLFRHFPDHFHFHGSAGLIPKVNLSLRHIKARPQYLHPYFLKRLVQRSHLPQWVQWKLKSSI